ncbi:ATP-binding protein [Thermoflexibacter ruber]|uniref:histidine kinase n=1 Tax=Thermoflexibacter ruber TaxID=1003 RepID=A0A1I2EK92_9BACT|nr:ATP-binding protein [Thermoflexibacter ruber]SFE93169.1 Signal transduction histidine kinase [Thermoflexibacter ruber]
MKLSNTQYQVLHILIARLLQTFLVAGLISFLVGNYSLYAQGGGQLTIRVFDENNAKLAGVTVRLAGSKIERTTDGKGEVRFYLEDRAGFDANSLVFIKKGKSVKSYSLSPDGKEMIVIMHNTQENSGTLYDERGSLMANTPVKYIDFNETVVTTKTGRFTIHTPVNQKVSKDSKFEVKGILIAKEDINTEQQPNGTVRFSLIYREPKTIANNKNTVQKQEGISEYIIYLEDKKPAANLKVFINEDSYITNTEGKITLKSPITQLIEPIFPESYLVTHKEQDNRYAYIFIKKAQTEIPPPNTSGVRENIEKITEELLTVPILLREKSKRISAEIVKIEDKIKNDKSLTEAQKKKYTEVLANLKETLAKNEETYNQLQQQSGEVLAQMQLLIASKQDSLKKQAELAKILQEKYEKIEAEKRQLAAEFRNKIILFSLIALVFAFAAIFLFILSRRLDKQKKELAETLAQVQAQKVQIEQQNTQLQVQKQEIEQKNTRLEDLDREKNSLMNIVAHDLKAPLNKIAGAAQLLPNLGDLNEEQEEFVQMIRKVAFEGKKFIEDLLDINAIEQQKPEAINWEKVDLENFLIPVVNSYKQQAENKKIQLHFDQQLNTKVIDADRSYLNRILDNLVSNAIKFSPQEKNIYISAVENSHIVSISVKDEGPGISPEDQKKMFKKFQKLSARPTAGESSTGLGLSIIKTLVERMNGKISVNSELGKGTEFVIELPKEKKV